MSRNLPALLFVLILSTSCSSDGASERPQVEVSTSRPPMSSPVETSPTTAQEGSGEPTAANDLTCWSRPGNGKPGPVAFADATTDLGLVDPLVGIYGHAAAFGDIDGDLDLDLFVGTFADRPAEEYRERGATGPAPDRLLLGGDTFTATDRELVAPGRTSGAVFADFDADGDADLLLVRNAGLSGDQGQPSVLLENREGELRPAVELLSDDFLGRTPAVADFDGDGLLDLYIAEDRYGETGGRLLRNEGALRFVDRTVGSGLEGTFSLGATAADLDGDGIVDLVLSERVFVGLGDLRFSDVTPEGFEWEQIGPDDDAAGVAVGDLDNDGRADIVVGQHFRSTLEAGSTVPIRLFVNTGGVGEEIGFEEATEAAGLVPLPTLAPHVEIADIDNDGWSDIVAAAAASDAPAVFRNRGNRPVSFEPPLGLGSAQYWVGAPVVDIDRDGRLDVFGLEWEPSLPSRVFRNTTNAGHWIQLSVSGPGQGVGSIVELLDESGQLIGRREIGVSGGYASGGPPYAHFGLGDRTEISLRLTLPLAEPVEIAGPQVDVHLRWPEGCG